jgi:hypothetical protein
MQTLTTVTAMNLAFMILLTCFCSGTPWNLRRARLIILGDQPFDISRKIVILLSRDETT